jgi:hypothetical protein
MVLKLDEWRDNVYPCGLSWKGPVMLQNILWFVAVVVIIGAIFSLFRGLLKWGIILLIVALLFGGFGFFA